MKIRVRLGRPLRPSGANFKETTDLSGCPVPRSFLTTETSHDQCRLLSKEDHRRRVSSPLTPPPRVLTCVCSELDLRKVTEILTRMFYEPHSKVLGVFVETIVDLVSVHAGDLTHWLHVLLPRLFLKLTSDLRGSIHTKLQLALHAVRWLPALLFCVYLDRIACTSTR